MSYSDLPGLNAYIADKSYIEGYAFSPKDVEVRSGVLKVFSSAALSASFMLPTYHIGTNICRITPYLCCRHHIL